MGEQPRYQDPSHGRDESPVERMDRNWEELLQELRVTQTGTQILTGFLLTLPFQQRFSDLDTHQVRLYLVLVVLASVATVLIVTPVSLHRLLFRRGLKAELVDAAHAFARAGLGALALVLIGAAMLLFDVVVSRPAGWTVAAGLALLVVLAWVAVPHVIVRRSRG